MTDIVERLRSKRYVREQWHEPIGTQVVSCDEDDEGAEAILRNPDGLEAATIIETLRRELDEAREAIERATLAERERCAGIAENDTHFPQEGAHIAQAIRALQETPDAE